MIEHTGGQFFVGVVEDRNDPLNCGRVRVRVVGLHYHDKAVLPTADLPWAMIMQPAAGGTSVAAVGPAEGTTVIVIFEDFPECQYPIVIGTLAGIPQQKQVNVDKFEDRPVWKDDITPQGRPMPTNAAEATGNHGGGPIDISTPTTPSLAGITSTGNTVQSSNSIANPALATIVQSSFANNPATSRDLISSIIDPGASTLGAIGGILDSVNQVGATINIAKNQFELLAKTYGNFDVAVKQFTMIASQSGALGNALAAVFNGQASLKAIAQNFGFGIASIQSAVAGIKNAKDISGVLNNAEIAINQGESLLGSISGTASAVANEFNQLSVDRTISSIANSATNVAQQITGEAAGTASAAANSMQRVASMLGLGNITGDFQDLLSSVNKVFQSPEKVASVLNGEYSTKGPVATNAGNIVVLTEKDPSSVTHADFANVPEGSTPPINGCYGGPNYGGASPVLEKPKLAIPPEKIAKGSTAELNITPPKGFDNATVRANIKTIINACNKYGLTTKEQQASLLGIIGGECGWVPQNEDCQYHDPDRLCMIFQSTFKGKPDLAQKYCNWRKGNKGAPEEFFNFVYDPSNNGRQLGNIMPGDGGKYFGRGFIQLTGRSNYERYAALSGHPIDKNPDLLNDPVVAADVAVLYLMDRVKHAVPTAHPGYFLAAKKSVGNNSPDIAKRKMEFYEHFYGTLAPESYGASDKTAGNTVPPNTYDGAASGNEGGKDDGYGFKDPHGKYPLKRYVNEPQTNRLARGVVKDTIVLKKQSQREIGVPIALNGGSWSQPQVPYGAKYPYNWVRETESGHIQEFDDTPGYERIHTYHRAGTFEEIDANGTVVRRIVGDNYQIWERNGFISIHGDCNVTVEGNVNIFCRSDANIEVAGSAEMKVGGNFDIGVARDMNIAVEGNFSVWANGTMNVQSKGKGHIRANDNLYIASNAEIHTLSEQRTLMLSKADMHVKTNADLYVQSINKTNVKAGGDFDLLTDANFNAKAAANINVDSGATLNSIAANNVNVTAGSVLNLIGAGGTITTAGGVSLKSSSKIALDGSTVQLNNGSASSPTETSRHADAAVAASDAGKAVIHGMVPPPLGTPIYQKIDRLAGPETHGEEQYMYESDAAGNTQASKKFIENRDQQNGKSNTYESEKTMPSGGNGSVIIPANQKQILACSEFNGNYRLSKHFTLGMLFDGGFNVKHKLIAQCGLTPQQIVANLASLAENILEKYLEVLPNGIDGYGKLWTITSGYRMTGVVSAQSSTSDHPAGRACDISLLGPGGSDRKRRHYELIQKLDKLVSYDQLILEYSGPTTSWIHTGFRGTSPGQTFGVGAGSNRKMAFTMVDHKTHSQGWTLLA
jgi:predicted chitinase